MTARELIDKIPAAPGDRRTQLLYFRIFAHFLAEHIYELELRGEYGDYPCGESDVTTVKLFFTELNSELERELETGRKKSA
jgi:hypothetical protein